MSFVSDVTRCFRCNTVYPVGNQHFCGTTVPNVPTHDTTFPRTVPIDRTDELTRRLDRIIVLLEKLTK